MTEHRNDGDGIRYSMPSSHLEGAAADGHKHHWVIDPADTAQGKGRVRGVCNGCNEVRYFPTAFESTDPTEKEKQKKESLKRLPHRTLSDLQVRTFKFLLGLQGTIPKNRRVLITRIYPFLASSSTISQSKEYDLVYRAIKSGLKTIKEFWYREPFNEQDRKILEAAKAQYRSFSAFQESIERWQNKK